MMMNDDHDDHDDDGDDDDDDDDDDDKTSTRMRHDCVEWGKRRERERET